MTQSYEDWYEENKHKPPYFYPKREDLPPIKAMRVGDYNNPIPYKLCILLNYGEREQEPEIIYVENTKDKQLEKDFNEYNCKLYFDGENLLLDFNQDYYYEIMEIDLFKNQYNFILNHKKITIALLNPDKTGFINKWTIDIGFI